MKTHKSVGLRTRQGKPSDQGVKIVTLQAGSHDDIATLAYKLWQQRGCPDGSDQEDWFRAEDELKWSRVLVAAP
jgi:hypothetical protein